LILVRNGEKGQVEAVKKDQEVERLKAYVNKLEHAIDLYG
jgi:hypothetical protein